MQFRYLRDPLFLGCLLVYFLNRFLLKPHFSAAFLHDHLNDVICIPFWVPTMLFVQRSIGLRFHDDPPGAMEIIIPLILWSWTFELWLPYTAYCRSWCTSDPEDILWYAIGALGAAMFWRRFYRRRVDIRGTGAPPVLSAH